MNFQRILELRKAPIGTNTPEKIKLYNKCEKYNPAKGDYYLGAKGLPVPAKHISAARQTAAIAYGNDLIEAKDSDCSGQIQILNDAKARKPEAMDFIWLILQSITAKSYWNFRVGSRSTPQRKAHTGMNLANWNEWLGLCYEMLFYEDGDPERSPEIQGKSIVDGFNTADDASGGDPAAALNNFAHRYSMDLMNVARALNEKDKANGWKTPDVRKVKDETPEQYEARMAKTKVNQGSLNSINRTTGEEIGNSMSQKSSFTSPVDEDDEFNNIYVQSKGSDAFTSKFKKAVKALNSVTGPGGEKPASALLYRLGKPLGEPKEGQGEKVFHPSVKKILDQFPPEIHRAIKPVLADFAGWLEKNGISKREMYEYASNVEGQQRLWDIIEAA